jgi:hypothetical protein
MWEGVLSPAELGVVPGQTILLEARARDAAPRAADAYGQSDQRRLRVVTAESLKQLIDQDRLVLSRMLDNLADDVNTQRTRLQNRRIDP